MQALPPSILHVLWQPAVTIQNGALIPPASKISFMPSASVLFFRTTFRITVLCSFSCCRNLAIPRQLVKDGVSANQMPLMIRLQTLAPVFLLSQELFAPSVPQGSCRQGV